MSGSVNMLLEMGFSKENAEKALSLTGNDVEAAMEWLLAHSESLDNTETSTTAAGDQNQVQNSECAATPESVSDVSVTAPSSATSADTPKSIKCDECGKLFTSQVEVEFHAAKTNHSSFSESCEEKKPLTEEEKAEQMRKIEEKLKQKRREREEKEKIEALEREKSRIQSGKEMIAAKKKLEDQEMKKLIDQRKREKMEDKLARERVREQIEQDRLARKEKFGGGSQTTSNQTIQSLKSVSAPQKDYSQTKLQIRLTNGLAITHTFGAKEQLSAVRLFIELNRTDGSTPFSLMTSFPKKVFTEEDYDKPLDLLGLVPSAVLIVSKTGLPCQSFSEFS